MITFLVPCRGRISQIQGLVVNLEKYYKDFKVMLCEQADNLLFRRGQLLNLGFKRVDTDVVAFINADYRFMEYVDLLYELHLAKQPICPFSYACKVKESKPGNLVKLTNVGRSNNTGGCQVFTKDMFIQCGGHTNLFLGWGPDDAVLTQRVKRIFSGDGFKKLCYTMGHVQHDKFVEYRERTMMKDRNCSIYAQLGLDPRCDSFIETLGDEVNHVIVSSKVERYQFTNIRVPNDYIYMKQYSDQIAKERKILSLGDQR